MGVCRSQAFTGNKDADSVVKNTLTQPLHARYVRILVKTWHGRVAMRIELYGCSGKLLFIENS